MQANTSTAPPLPNVRGVTLQYKTRQHPVTTIYRVDFQVYPDERYILLGPPGRDKSTLLKAIDGYLIPTEDEVRLKSQPITKPGPDHMMMFQGFDRLLSWKTVKENALLPLFSTGKLGTHEAEERALHYINEVNLTKFADRYSRMPSGGMKQCMATTRDVAMEPNMLLIDEPFATLDALTRRKMQDELLQLWDEMRFTALFVTHSIPEAIRCDSHTLIPSPCPGQVCTGLSSLIRGDNDPERFEALKAEIHGMPFAHVVEEIRTD